MNIVVLCRKANSYFIQRLEQIAKPSKTQVTVVDPLSCELVLNGKQSQILYKGKPLLKPNFVIPRMGTAILDYGLNVLRHFELMDVPVLNNASAITNAFKRYEYLQILSTSDKIQTPRSVLIRKSNQIKAALKLVNGPPAMLKLISSNNKLGAMMIESVASAESFLDVNSIMGGLGQIGQSIIIEEFVKESKGRSIHLLTLKDQVIGCHYKIKAFNLKQSSGLFNKQNQGYMEPPQDMCDMAIAALEVLDLDFAVVSFVESLEGPKIFQVDFNPQIEIFDKDPNVQVSAKILASINNSVKRNVVSGVE